MGINPFTHGSAVHTDVMKTQALKQALDQYGFDAAFGGARRDEEKSRAKERVFSIRSAQHRWDPKQQRPELWRAVQHAQAQGRKHPRVPAVELDRARRLAVHLPGEHSDRPAVLRQASGPSSSATARWIMVDDDRMPLEPGETPEMRKVRFRTLGCYPLTGAIESDADTLPAIIQEMLLTRHLRAPGPRHRSRSVGVDGEEEARRVLLMAHVSELIDADIEAYLRAHERKSLLRFITCGSVDDGKSTLIGRLLYESKMIFEDQLAALAADSKKVGTRGGELDFALLVDGLSAEREQGITIDVAYRFFSTDKRKFIVADTPGHEQYTRNMVTGASTADLAVILIDARKGVLTQTRRHSYLVSLLGIRRVVLAINKMDLVDYSQRGVRAHRARLPRVRRRASASSDVTCIPDVGGPRRQRRRRRSADDALVRRARRCCEHLENVAGRRRPRGEAVPPAGAVGEPADRRLPRLRRPRSSAAPFASAIRFACCRRARQSRVARILGRRPRSSRRRSPGSRSR